MIRDKTDLLTVLFTGNHKPDLFCNRTDLILMVFANRHQCMC